MSIICACSANVENNSPNEVNPETTLEGLSGMTIVSPNSNQAYQAFELNYWGELQATVSIEVEIGDLDSVSLVLAGEELLSLYDDIRSAEVALPAHGPSELKFVGYKDGQQAQIQTIKVFVDEPYEMDCFELLDLYQIHWDDAAASPGIEKPVSLQMPLNRINYRYVEFDAIRSNLYLDCELALALVRANPLYLQKEVSTVIDFGVYNYRCIGGEGIPPDCPRGISAHSNGKAIDVFGYELEDSAVYNIEDEWIIDEDDTPTCDATTEPGPNQWLHELVCEQTKRGIWNTVLTPNFNNAHRNHFHLDLKEGNDFTKKLDH